MQAKLRTTEILKAPPHSMSLATL